MVTNRNSLQTCSCNEERKFMLLSPELRCRVLKEEDSNMSEKQGPLLPPSGVPRCHLQAVRCSDILHGVMSRKTRILNFTTVKTSRNWSPSLDPCSVVRDSNLQPLLFTFLLFAAYGKDRLDGLRHVPSHTIRTRGTWVRIPVGVYFFVSFRP
jgi:hypothetical protein